MGQMAEIEIDAWLRDGGIVVAATDRATRALTLAYQRRRQVRAVRLCAKSSTSSKAMT